MSKLILYIACSLDGYIADKNGGISFLNEVPPEDFNAVYDGFYASIGTLIMGGKTYRQLANELSPDNWPYAGKKCFVYTKTTLESTTEVEAITLPPTELLAKIRGINEENIWLMGGGEIIRLFLEENLIDRYYIYIIPKLLGGGVRLFPNGFPLTALSLERAQKVGGMVEIIYNKQP